MGGVSSGIRKLHREHGDWSGQSYVLLPTKHESSTVAIANLNRHKAFISIARGGSQECSGHIHESYCQIEMKVLTAP